MLQAQCRRWGRHCAPEACCCRWTGTDTKRNLRRGDDAQKAPGAVVEAERSGEGSAPNGSGSGNLGSSKGANGSSRCQAAGAGDSATKAGGAQCQGSNQPQARPGFEVLVCWPCNAVAE